MWEGEAEGENQGPWSSEAQAHAQGRHVGRGGPCRWVVHVEGRASKGRRGAQGGRGGPPTPEREHSLSFPSFPEGLGRQWPHGHRGQEGRLGPPGSPGVSCPSVPMRGPRVAHLGMNRESALQLGLCYCKFRTGVFQLFGHCPLQGLLFRLSGSPPGAGHLGGGGRRAGSADRLVSCPSSVSLHCTAGRAGVSRSPA